MELNLIYTIIISVVIASFTYLFAKNKFLRHYEHNSSELRKEIEAKKNELDYLKVKQTKFWDVISNQLRSLFYSFYNSIELLNAGYDDLSADEKKELIGNIGKSYDQTLGIINELLEWVKANRRRQNSTPEYVNLSTLVEENIAHFHSSFMKKELIVEKELGESIPVYCDKMMIDFVIKSLIVNAIKFTPKEGTIKIRCNKIGNRAELIVSDSGVGIPKENMDRLLKLDEIISTAGTENEKGSGLGLLICKDFVELNNGKLELKSEFGNGTTVIVILQGTEN